MYVRINYVCMLLSLIPQAAAALLQAPTEPVNDSTYFECLDVVADRSQVCGSGVCGRVGGGVGCAVGDGVGCVVGWLSGWTFHTHNMWSSARCGTVRVVMPVVVLLCLLQVLGQTGADIPTHAKNGDIDEFGTAVGNLASAVCQITEAGAQVGLSTRRQHV